jgi:hypothetical protein
MSVYVITGVSKGIGVSLPYTKFHVALTQPNLVRVRQTDLRRPKEPSRRFSPRQGWD